MNMAMSLITIFRTKTQMKNKIKSKVSSHLFETDIGVNKDKNDEEVVDLTKYKGIYFNDDNKKFQDDETGAHFQFLDLCKRIEFVIQIRRRQEEKERQKNEAK